MDGTAATASAQSLAAHGGDESAIVYKPLDIFEKDGVILGPEKIKLRDDCG